MRNIIKATWLITIIFFSGLMICSVTYEIDGFQGLINFGFYIDDVGVLTNSSNDFVTIRVSGSLYNPSHFSSYQLRKVDAIVFLNGEQGEYLRGPKWFYLNLPCRANTSLMWSYVIEAADLDMVNNANSTSAWIWYFYLQVTLLTDMIGFQQFDRSQAYIGVTINPLLS